MVEEGLMVEFTKLQEQNLNRFVFFELLHAQDSTVAEILRNVSSWVVVI
jgi:hypothetical protein